MVVSALTVVVVLQISNIIYGYKKKIVNDDCKYDISSCTYDLLCRTYDADFNFFILVVALTQLRRMSIDKQNIVSTKLLISHLPLTRV